MISLNGSLAKVPNLILFENKNPNLVLSVLWDSLKIQLNNCFPIREPEYAKGWILSEWHFKTNPHGWQMSWIDVQDPSKLFHLHYPNTDFWKTLLRISKHELCECLEINGQKIFNPHKSGFRRMGKKTHYFGRS